jgi:2,3-bisphosphoglycerate-dependent phosphoglycerate mutase
MNKTIYLVRHCETSGQEPDASLTPAGREQAHILGAWLSRMAVERVVSSPYARAYQSAVPLAGRLNLPVDTDARLVERVLSGTPLSDWRENLAASFTEWDRCLPGGESSRAATARGVAALCDVLSHPVTVTVVVTHGNLLALLLKHYDDAVGFAEWQRLTNPDVYRVQFGGDPPHVERLTADITG